MLKCFAEKMWVTFAEKLLTFFQQKISEYCILNPLKVNEMTLNELVKLMTLWTTGPRWLFGKQVPNKRIHPNGHYSGLPFLKGATLIGQNRLPLSANPFIKGSPHWDEISRKSNHFVLEWSRLQREMTTYECSLSGISILIKFSCEEFQLTISSDKAC